MITRIIRTIILYFVVILSMRLMGKRQIGDLEPIELVIAMMISDLASIPMQQSGIPLLFGIAPILVLVFLEIIMSFFSIKSKKFRKLIAGKPSIVVRNGHIFVDELRKLRMSKEDLLEQLRISGCFNLQDVDFAIMEKQGDISVKLKNDVQPLTPQKYEKINSKEGAKK